MQIKGLEGATKEQIQLEVQHGAKFVIYQYCISVLVITFKRPSDIYYVRPNESAVTQGLGFTLLSLLAGWWGIPWGPIYTIQSVWVNFHGGRDVTQSVLTSLGTLKAART
ncbi:MAG TPA: hypothetical protein VF173_26625 [Thermoanaerobaculia bacterium]|nr:hypothetical protein [Thermoanaerobaculia bacterium]